MSGEKPLKWRKVLYEDQGVADNYVDKTFLDEMEKNLYIRTYEFWPVVRESGVVTQQICSVCLFVVAFIYMDDNSLSPDMLLMCTTILSACGYIISDCFLTSDTKEYERTRSDDMKSILAFVGFGYGLSPVLMTLTDTISTDTIYAMTVCMLFANLLFHDYGAGAGMVSHPFSLNAAIFASVCLASRLPTTRHAFTTVSFAVVMFALWPVLRRRFRDRFPWSHDLFTVLLGLLTVVFIGSISVTAALLFSLLHIFVTFVCPAWLIKLQPYKNNIYGPWDEAVILD